MTIKKTVVSIWGNNRVPPRTKNPGYACVITCPCLIGKNVTDSWHVQQSGSLWSFWKLVLLTSRKSQTGFLLVPDSDLEWPWTAYGR